VALYSKVKGKAEWSPIMENWSMQDLSKQFLERYDAETVPERDIISWRYPLQRIQICPSTLANMFPAGDQNKDNSSMKVARAGVI
jgi:hypothetical protein